MKYLVVSPGYPSETDPYSNAFVHERVKRYIEAGLNVEVYSVSRKLFSPKKNGASYHYNYIHVEQGNVAELKQKIRSGQYEKILVHFGFELVVSAAVKAVPKTPLIIWFHGVDSIGWYRRMYNLQLRNAVKFAGYIPINILQRFSLRRILVHHGDRIHCIFVSEWLKQIAEKDMHCVGRIKHASVIPNIVNDETFPYRPKDPEDRLNILSIRSFASKKYANDQTVKAIQALTSKPYFGELTFRICGDGRLWDSTVKPLKQYPNVHLMRRFFSHDQIVELHSRHGVMLMPSRQDTHGISTCEGMSSGLVPITSNNSAIPEYVPAFCGYLTNNYLELADAIEDLYNNPHKFLDLSKKAAEFIRIKCAVPVIVSREIDLISR